MGGGSVPSDLPQAQLNVVSCSFCGARGEVDHFLILTVRPPAAVVHRAARRHPTQAVPADGSDQLGQPSCRATASSEVVESNARRCFPANAPVAVITPRRLRRSVAGDHWRSADVANMSARDETLPHRSRGRRQRSTVDPTSPARRCHDQKPCKPCNTITETISPARIGGRPTTGREQIGNHVRREQPVPMLG